MAFVHMNQDPSNCKPLTAIEWKSTEKDDHHKFSPAGILQPCNISQSLMNKEKAEKQEAIEKEYSIARAVRKRAKKLPQGLGYFASLHVLVNQERVSRDIMPLHRSIELDELASIHARYMSEERHLVHSDASNLMTKVSKIGPCRRLGENIQKGKSSKEVHKKMMHSSILADRNNILDRRYVSFGVGAVKNDYNEVYVCQIFRG